MSRMRTLFLSLLLILEQGSQMTLTVLPLGSSFLERVFGGCTWLPDFKKCCCSAIFRLGTLGSLLGQYGTDRMT